MYKKEMRENRINLFCAGQDDFFSSAQRSENNVLVKISEAARLEPGSLRVRCVGLPPGQSARFVMFNV